MNSGLSARLEKAFVLVLVLSFTVPLALGAWLRLSHDTSPGSAWFRNATLNGEQPPPQEVTFKRSKVILAKFQSAVAKNFNNGFPGRELLIRTINEIYLRVFHRTNVGVLAGPGLALVEHAYAEEYCLARPRPDALRPLAENLRRMQDFCAARGIAFALVITPSKASIQPRTLPAGWRRRHRPEPRYYDTFLPLLNEKGVHYVDGHRITAGLKTPGQVPLFPQGGVHWGDPAAFATANALLEMLASQGLAVAPCRDFAVSLSNEPKGQDTDLARLINIASILRYPVANITVKPAAGTHAKDRPTMAIVGGSFVWKLLDFTGDTRQFSEQDFYTYYRVSKHARAAGGTVRHVSTPAPPMDFDCDIFAADSLVLEVNEEMLPAPKHLEVFLHDALAVLPDPHSARAPFHYESVFTYHWGDILSFVSTKCPQTLVTTEGFSSPSDLGIVTEKATPAAILLHTPPAADDIILRVTAAPFIVPDRLPRQVVEVSVNGHWAGEWVWTEPRHAARELTIPRAFFDGEDVSRLEFRVPTAASPAHFGVGVDTRPLGVFVSSLQMRLAHGVPDAVPAEQLPTYQWGDTLALANRARIEGAAAEGFSEPGPDGPYTIGPVASLRFKTPPAPGDMVLEFTARALILAPRLARQTVDVLVNRHPIGKWVATDVTPARRELVIPKDFLEGGEVLLEFRVERPMAPAELGLNADPRKLGVCISSVRLHAPGM